MRCHVLTGHDSPTLQLTEAATPVPGQGQLAVSIKAASLNYRDLLVSKRCSGVVPLSDGAGIVSAIGPGVQGYRVGDRVIIGFMPGWVEGPITEAKKATALGSQTVGGVLTECIVVPAGGVVPMPDGMSFEEAATLPCAGVTAWAALFERRPLLPGETVLLLGTGGVSIFALQLAKMAGAKVIITSSDDDKLVRAKALGADHTINYKTHPDWETEVLAITGGTGVDLTVDAAGPGTLNHSLKATRFDGRISLMGVLTGFDGPIDTKSILERRITLQGIYVGPVSSLSTLAATGIKPQIDHIFPFDQANAAYAALQAAKHFGKLVIRVGD